MQKTITARTVPKSRKRKIILKLFLASNLHSPLAIQEPYQKPFQMQNNVSYVKHALAYFLHSPLAMQEVGHCKNRAKTIKNKFYYLSVWPTSCITYSMVRESRNARTGPPWMAYNLHSIEIHARKGPKLFSLFFTFIAFFSFFF